MVATSTDPPFPCGSCSTPVMQGIACAKQAPRSASHLQCSTLHALQLQVNASLPPSTNVMALHRVASIGNGGIAVHVRGLGQLRWLWTTVNLRVSAG